MNKSHKLNTDILPLLINLDRSKKRLVQSISEFKKAGFEVERISAIDGKTHKYTSSEFCEKKFNRCVGRKINPAEIACYLSHYKAIQAFMSSGRKYALIFEDDIILSSDFVKIVNNLTEISSFWDFVKFNTANDNGILNINVKKLTNEYRLVASFFPKTYSAAYIINRKAAKNLCEKLLPMSVPYDHEMIKFWKYNIRQFSVFPSPVQVRYENSFIGEYYNNKSNRFPFYRRIPVLLYRVYTQLIRSLNFYKLIKNV